MPRGGPRNRSGPPLDPKSGRSEARGIKLDALPAEGWAGRAPVWPLSDQTDREVEVWAELWRTPQAAMWARESWRWPIVAMYARLRIVCEAHDAPASHLAQLHRFADQIGLTPAGLRENGWSIAKDEVGERAAAKAATTRKRQPSARDRLKVVNGDGGA